MKLFQNLAEFVLFEMQLCSRRLNDIDRCHGQMEISEIKIVNKTIV